MGGQLLEWMQYILCFLERTAGFYRCVALNLFFYQALFCFISWNQGWLYIYTKNKVRVDLPELEYAA